MTAGKRRFSIVSQPLDRAALLAYFLGGIVPLAALVWVARRYAGTALLEPRLGGLVLSLTLLSFGSFLLLRRTTRTALRRAELDNRRLARLVADSGSLAQTTDREEVTGVATRSAAALFGSQAAFFLVLDDHGEATLMQSVGRAADAVYASHAAEIEELTALAAPETAEVGTAELLHAEIADGPAVAIGVGAGDGFEGALVLVHCSTPLHDPGASGALTTLARLVTVALHNCDLQADQRNFFSHVTNLLVLALDSHLDYQSDHSRRVAHLANRLGRALAFDEARLHLLHFASLLHDIGMLTIDRESLTVGREAVERHPVLGYEMLRPINLWSEVAPVVRHHHEWFDGEGYPDGLAGEEIPIESRVIAVAEAYDSMTSSQSYRTALDPAEALDRIRRGSGSQFDPRVVDVLLELAAGGDLHSS